MKLYKIVRIYEKDFSRRTIRKGLTLEQARAHCTDPETSSTSCTNRAGKRRTKRLGRWFDAYDNL